MPHRSFGAAQITEERDPITFDFGIFSEETFTVVPDPSIGDTFDLYNLPDITPANMGLPEITMTLSRFIRRMLKPEDKPRFDQALYRIPSTQLHLITECALFIAENVTARPSQPSAASSSGRLSTTKT